MGRPKKAAKVVEKKPKPEEKISQMGGNIKGLHDEIRDGYEKIEKLKEERSAINAKIKAIREDMNAKGIVKDAFDAAMTYANMAPERREGFDTAYIIAREAVGLPVKGAQADLFEGTEAAPADSGEGQGGDEEGDDGEE